ncbi:hypothetical protein L1049_028326 [Liquidambar formosana]|uniref:BURP domain-containing protein n=1 Tax=Liquidambar formosana TaxID=63359 RepID=A0AAP0RKE4_LIQFO
MPEKDANFAVYSNKRFATYGTSRLGGADSFKNYSDGINIPNDLFTRYSRDSIGHDETFTNYAHDANVANGTFTNYGSGATGGSGEFKNYDPLVNVPHLRFTTYDSNANDHKLSFSSYIDDTNSSDEVFTSYGKSGNGVPTEFTNYGDNSNAIGSTFSAYGESGNGANDTFKGYSNGGNSAIDSFSNYKDEANVGVDTFQSYAKNSNYVKASFANYGKSFNEGENSFREYAKGSVNQAVGFKIYGLNSTFKAYADKGVTFSHYSNSSSATGGVTNNSGNSVNRWVEPGKFFRESMLKEGNVMENSTMERVITNALAECERAPSQGETKRCVGSVEDMIDFAVSVFGHDIVVRTTQNVNGSKENVIIGKVRGINGGKVTKSMSCHQSLFPYLLYYCHSVPKVRVYEVDILNVESKAKINHGVAICHIDTSAWSQGHGAFVALGSSPGLIEVCHWIFENDMTWATAD